MKTARKVLSVLLAVLVLCSAVSLFASAKTASEVAVGENFLFGMYPQELVRDSELIKTLKASKPDADGNVTIGANTYKRGYMEKFADGFNTNWMRYFGYELKTEYWFRYAPIEWRVLANDADGVLLMSECVLDTHKFNEKASQGNDWVDSDIRAWLNGEFMNAAFNATEQGSILQTELENKGNFVCKTAGSANTVDRVFLPSFEEITNWKYGFNLEWLEWENDGAIGTDRELKEPFNTVIFDNNGNFLRYAIYDDFGNFPGYYSLDPARKALRTDYSEFRGVWIDDSEEIPFGDPVEYEGQTQYGRYWLRTEGRNNDVNFVLCDGRVSMGWPSDYAIMGVRPMIRVSPDALQDPIRLYAADGAVRYRQSGIKIDSNMDGYLEFESSDPSIAEIDRYTGDVTIKDVGTVTFTATLKDDPTTSASCSLKIEYAWWQQAIRIFLFGWIWY